MIRDLERLLFHFTNWSTIGLLIGFGFSPLSSVAQDIPQELKDIGIVEKLGSKVSVQDLQFKDETGNQVKLSDYFHKGRPVLISLAYYGCPTLCTFVFNGIVDSLKGQEWIPGREFELVTVSIDHREGPELAAKKKTAYIASYVSAGGKPIAASGWHFLTGKEDQIKKLASEIGFGFRYVENEKQYAHSAAIFALTPEGKISRYLYGIQFPWKDLKLALLEASDGRIGTVIDRILLFCYRYDPTTRKYSVYLTRVMQAGSASTVLVFGGYLAVFWRRQRRDSQGESGSHV